jgi:capsular polysaccharide export protein
VARAPALPHYEHHRCLHPVREGSRWLRGGWRKWHNRWAERHMQDFLSAPEQHKRYFLVPLQVHNDAQVTRHSRFATVAEFIVEVMASFARMRRRTSCWCSSTTRWTGPTTTTAS